MYLPKPKNPFSLFVDVGTSIIVLMWTFYVAFITAMSGYDIPTKGDATLAVGVVLAAALAARLACHRAPIPIRFVIVLSIAYLGGLAGYNLGEAPMPQKFCPESNESIEF